MAFSEEIKKEIEDYCNSHLAKDLWYDNEFSFIRNVELKKRIIAEFKAIRFAYKLYEGIGATGDNLMFEVRNQIFAYASIYEAVVEYILTTYYSDTFEYDCLMHHTVPIKISIPQDKEKELQEALSHDGKDIVTFYYGRKEKQKPQVRFDDKCRTAEKLGLIHRFTNNKGVEIDLPAELIEIYSYRNGIHIIAEQRKGINYELDLSKIAYYRMRPFIDQVKKRLLQDGKIENSI